MKHRRLGLCALAATATLTFTALSGPDAEAPITRPMESPHYDRNGALLRPSEPRNWRFVGTSYGLGYSKRTRPGADTFKNIYMQQEAFDAFMARGEFPEQTMLAMLIFETATAESPRERGYFQGDMVAMEIAVKDTDRFETGWAYFDFGEAGDGARSTPFPQDSGCNDCHAENGHDNVFTQFYPELRRRSEVGTDD